MTGKFDLHRFVREVMALPGHAELLAQARIAAEDALGCPVYAVHVLPGRPWEQATIASPQVDRPREPQAVRSALFAIHRRLSLASTTLRLDRADETASLFRALHAGDGGELVAVPLRSRTGRLSGALVAAVFAADTATTDIDTLETIAQLTGPTMEAAWQHTLARRDQERLRLFSETTEESLWDWVFLREEVWWGGNMEQLFGGQAHVSKRPDWRRTRIHVDDAARVESSFDAALGSSATSWNAEYRLRGVDDSFIHVREHVYFLREVDGQAYRAIGTIRNVSALQRLLERETLARAAAEKANEVKDEFLALLGHELRNPLAPIVAVLGLMERRATGPDRQLEILRRQTNHLVGLVDDLLDVSRIASGKIELDLRRTRLEPLVQRALEMVHPLIEKRHHRVDLEIDAAVEVDVDEKRMTQVLSNLLANAAKYTESGGHLHVQATTLGAGVVIRIRDDGIGIPAELLPHVFDMFTQGRQSMDRAQGGLGLGLSIVKNIVRLHGGSVEAHSDGPGEGTEIVVRLPAAARAMEVAAAPMAAFAPTAQARDILIVEDNEDIASTLADALRDAGHTVRTAHHPAKALELFDQREPNLALVDIGLPSIDGYELVRHMRSRSVHSQTKYAAITGYGQASDKLRAREAGFDAHLVKPVAPDRLEALIHQLLG